MEYIVWLNLSCHAFKLHIQGGLDGPPHKTPNCLLTFYLNAQQLIRNYAGSYTGRIAIRFKPSFKLTVGGKSFDVHPKYLKTIYKADGYEYSS
jgi:hypothetical protein